MNRIHLSTNNVARMLNVNESSVKRWANSGSLKCFRTPGGHRKFLLKDVIEFSERFSFETSADVSALINNNGNASYNLEYAIHTKNFEALSIFLESIINKNDYEGALRFLDLMYANRILLADIFDKIVQPVLEHIGYLWEKGKLGIQDEHILTETIRRALGKFHENIHKKEPNGYSALCACLEGEYHDIAINCVRSALEAEGWLVYYMGTNLPAASLIKAIKSYQPNLLCISMTETHSKKTMQTLLVKIYTAVKTYGGSLVLGGAASRKLGKEDSNCDYIAGSINDLIDSSRSITNK